jgi:hypothetical protein
MCTNVLIAGRAQRALGNNKARWESENPTGQAVTMEHPIMTTTNGTPVEETSVELKDASNWAENITSTAINMRAGERLSGAARRLWEAGSPLHASDRFSPEHRHAVQLQLDALIMQPEVLAWVAREARDHLVKVEAAEVPQEAEPVTDTEAAPSPMYLEILEYLERGTFPPAELVDRFVTHDPIMGYVTWRIVDWVLWRAKVGRPLCRAADDDLFPIAFQAAKDLAIAELEVRWASQDRLRGWHTVSDDDARRFAHSRH